MKRFFIWNSLLLFLLILGVSGSSIAEASDSIWKAGLAKIETSDEGLILRLSLRNEGKTGRDSLTILGKWKGSQSAFIELGKFTKEVALTQTAILMIPLKPLGQPPTDKGLLELSLKTASQKTDSKTIPLLQP